LTVYVHVKSKQNINSSSRETLLTVISAKLQLSNKRTGKYRQRNHEYKIFCYSVHELWFL